MFSRICWTFLFALKDMDPELNYKNSRWLCLLQITENKFRTL